MALFNYVATSSLLIIVVTEVDLRTQVYPLNVQEEVHVHVSLH